jgi:alanine racemase
MTPKRTHQIWAEVNLDAIAHNIAQLRARLAPRVRMLAPVKANAYGHGLVPVARHVAQCGVHMLGVARYEEGVALRRAGITAPILIFGQTPPQAVPQLLANDLTATVFSTMAARQLSDAARGAHGRLKVHIKIDTGMGRLGLLADGLRLDLAADDISEITALVRMAGLEAEGIYTHFASADMPDKSDAGRQLDRFVDLLDRLAAAGVHFQLRHAANSAAIFTMPESHLDMVRPGIALYGLYPCDDIDRRATLLKPAMALKARIVHIKPVPAGFKISYGGTYTTPTATTIATIPVGYADGYFRALSSRGQMLVGGLRAPVVGRVCMDLTMLDVGHIPKAEVGSEVVILGSQGKETISAEEIAHLLNTIHYEVVSTIMARVPRVYH